MRRFPNARVLSILTTDTENKNEYNLVFASVTIVPDFYTGKQPYWYEGKGRTGSASFVGSQDKLRQWFACGKDDQIADLFKQVIESSELSVDGTIIKLHLPDFEQEKFIPNPFFDRSQNEADLYRAKNNLHFPRKLLEQHNCNILSGYEVENIDIKHLFPLGLYGENELINKFEKHVLAFKEHRKPYLTFHGVRKTDDGSKDVEEMIGFYQKDFDPMIEYEGRFYDNEKNEVGKGLIRHTDGIFQATISDPSGRGSVKIYENGEIAAGVEYTLLKDIKFDMNVASSTLTDAYGQNIMITDKERQRPSVIKSYTFQRDAFSVSKDANRKLSDTFIEMLKYLGPKIVIADPYYFNSISEDSVTKSLAVSDCQKAFLNAIVTTAVTAGIKSLSFLGCSRANNHFDKDTSKETTTKQQRMERYERLFKSIVSLNKLSKYIPTGHIGFHTATSDFHNRYWFSLDEEERSFTKVIAVTNSFGIMNEVDFFNVVDSDQAKMITHKYFKLFKTSNNDLSI